MHEIQKLRFFGISRYKIAILVEREFVKKNLSFWILWISGVQHFNENCHSTRTGIIVESELAIGLPVNFEMPMNLIIGMPVNFDMPVNFGMRVYFGKSGSWTQRFWVSFLIRMELLKRDTERSSTIQISILITLLKLISSGTGFDWCCFYYSIRNSLVGFAGSSICSKCIVQGGKDS